MMRAAELWQIRQKLALTVEGFARVLGVAPSTVELWDEQGERPLKISHANEDTARMIGQAADAARNPEALGAAMLRALREHGRHAAVYLALHTLFHKIAPKG